MNVLRLLCSELSSQKEQTVSKLREAREEKLSSWYISYDEQLTSFFDSSSRSRNLKEMVEVIRSSAADLILFIFYGK